MPTETVPWRGKALVPVLVYVGLLVALVSSLGAPLIPTIATDYHVSLGEAQWSLTLALLVGAVTSPVLGRLGDGQRRLHVLLAGSGAMVVGSVFAAVPIHLFALFLFGRGLQGCGLALLPLAMSVARDHLDRERADLRLMQHGAVVTANVTGLLAGVGMFMLMSMIIRYVQTPGSTGYGLGASVVVAGLVLLPWSAASFLSSQLVTYVSRWVSADRILPFSAVGFAVSLILFATMRDHLWEIFLEMAVGGIGIGCLFAVMPRMILSVVPAGQTGSALALNQVLRTIGFSIGSALAATILTAHTAAHDEFPANAGYTTGAVIAIGLCALTMAVSWALPARTERIVVGPEQAMLVEENVDAAIAGVLTLNSDETPNQAPAERTEPQ